MYDKILREMRKAVRAGRIRFVPHALGELSNDDLSPWRLCVNNETRAENQNADDAKPSS